MVLVSHPKHPRDSSLTPHCPHHYKLNNHMQDLNTKWDRIPEVLKKRILVKIAKVVLSIIIVAIMFTLSVQVQDYIKSFATTKQEMVKKFTKLDNVPTWRIVTN